MEKNKEVVSKGFINKGNKGLEEGREQVTWIPSRHILDTAPPHVYPGRGGSTEAP